MLRLTLVSQSTAEAVLQVDGRIAGKEVDILAREGDAQLRRVRRLVLELDGVQFIDETGMRLLHRWSRERLVLRGGSELVRMLLQANGLL